VWVPYNNRSVALLYSLFNSNSFHSTFTKLCENVCGCDNTPKLDNEPDCISFSEVIHMSLILAVWTSMEYYSPLCNLHKILAYYSSSCNQHEIWTSYLISWLNLFFIKFDHFWSPRNKISAWSATPMGKITQFCKVMSIDMTLQNWGIFIMGGLWENF